MKDPIFARRSVRKFLQKAVPKALLEEIIAAGIAAPSAKNRQPWHFAVFAGDAKAQMLESMERGLLREESGEPLLPQSRAGLGDAKNTLRIMREAPIVILVLNTNGTSPFRAVDSDARITEICDTLSIGAAVQNMLLRADALGLGTLWIANTCFAYTELCEYLQTQAQLVCAVAVGYAAENPAQRPRKSAEEVCEYRGFEK